MHSLLITITFGIYLDWSTAKKMNPPNCTVTIKDTIFVRNSTQSISVFYGKESAMLATSLKIILKKEEKLNVSVLRGQEREN